MQFSCAECGCVVEGGVRLSLCANDACCCAALPACDWATQQRSPVREPPEPR